MYQGVDGRRFQRVSVLSEGACDAIEGLWLNGERQEFRWADDNGQPYADQDNPTMRRVLVPAAGSRYGSRGWRIRFFPNGRDEVIKQFDADITPDGWEVTDRLTGKCYVTIECYQEDYGRDLGNRVWSQVPGFSFLIRGIHVPVPKTPPTDGRLASRDWSGIAASSDRLFLLAADNSIWTVRPSTGGLERVGSLSEAPDLFGSWSGGRVFLSAIHKGVGVGGRPFRTPTLFILDEEVVSQGPLLGRTYLENNANFNIIAWTNVASDTASGSDFILLAPGTVRPRTSIYFTPNRGIVPPTYTQFPAGYTLVGLCQHGDDLYTIDTATNTLARIDISTATPSISRVGTNGALGAGPWSGVASLGDVLYGLKDGAGGLVSIDTDTGAPTVYDGITSLFEREWSDLTPDILRWYMLTRLGWPEDIVDAAAYRAARLTANTQVTFIRPSGGGFDAYPNTYTRYTANGIIRSGDGPEQVLQELYHAMAGGVSEIGGYYFMRPGPPGVDRMRTFTIGEEDVAAYGPMRASGAIQDRVNAVSFGLDQSPEYEWSEFRAPVWQDAAAFARDGERYEQDLGTRIFVTEPVRGLQLAAIHLRQQRAQRTLSMTLLPGRGGRNLDLQPFDRGVVDLPDYGLPATPMDVFETRLNPNDTIDVVFQESPDGIYADTSILPPIHGGLS